MRGISRSADVAELRSASLRARGVGVVVDGVTLLDGVDVTVEPGQVVALLGPNGAGKSTLLACLAGDRRPSSGTVTLADRPLSEWTARERAHRRAVVTQESGVAFPFTVADVVRMGRAPWAGTAEEHRDDAVVADALATADVTPLAARTVPSLSGGERARTAFARSLAQRTPVLLLDEPTAALDLGHQEQLLATVRSLADAGSAVVVVLHDLSLAAAWSDRVVLLEGGRVVASGAPTEVVTADIVTRVYGHPVTVIPHPATGAPIVVPLRAAAVPAPR